MCHCPMKPTLAYIQQKVQDYNLLIFEGKLPPVPVELGNARTYLGQCVCKRQRTLTGIRKYDFRLRFSTRLDLSEQELEDVIIHEMIHYYIGVNQLKDRSAHGPLFRQMMNDINQKFGRHLRVSHRCTPEQRAQAIDKRRKLHTVAIIYFNDGRCGLKVLPCLQHRIVLYYNVLKRQDKVASLRLFLSNNPFFNQYPCSSALRVHYVDEAAVMAQLQEARPLVCNGTSVK